MIAPELAAPQDRHLIRARAYQGVPSIECTPDGTLFATWYSGGLDEGPDNFALLARSRDDGKTWKDPLAVIDTPGEYRNFDPLLWISPDGAMHWFWAFVHYPDGEREIGLDGVWMATCRDPQAEELVWEPPRRIADGIMLNKPIVLSTGEWALPVALWNFGKYTRGPELAEAGRSHMYVSEDAGATFTLRGSADVPNRWFDEHHIVELQDGRLWMLVRTSYGIGESFSEDRGVTWSPGRDSGITGPNSRFFIRRLASGSLLMVNHMGGVDNCRKLRRRLSAWISDDDGDSWQGPMQIDRYLGSYPDGCQGADGFIRVIYDYERKYFGDILIAKFTEQDVKVGKAVNPESDLRMLVSRTGGRRVPHDGPNPGVVPSLPPSPAHRKPLFTPTISAPQAKHRTDARQFQGIPGLERTADGTLWATWYAGGVDEGGDNFIVLVRSVDDGETWGEPVAVVDSPGAHRAYDPTLWLSPDGVLRWFWAQSDCTGLDIGTDGVDGVWMAACRNPLSEPLEWEPPRRIANGVMLNKPTALYTGEWAFPIALWNYDKYRPLPELADEGFSNMYVSSDQGNTFQRRGYADVPDRTFDEHQIVELHFGVLAMFVRTSYGIAVSYSYDRGVTWSPAEDSRIISPGSRFFVRTLSSGAVLLINHAVSTDNRKRRNNLAAWVGEAFFDQMPGRWEGPLMLDERLKVSYPDGCEGDDGFIRVIYDRDRYQCGEILMAKFTEDDVRARTLITPGSELRKLVNRTGGVRDPQTARSLRVPKE